MAENGAASRLQHLSPMQRQAGKFLAGCQNESVQVTVFAEIDVSRLMAVRTALSGAGKAPGITAFLIAALAKTLRQHPEFNAHYEDGALRLFDEVNIGLAVSLESGDLVTPVLRDVADKTVSEISDSAAALAEKARNAALVVADMRGAGFTLSNLGRSGVVRFATPIIPVPQVAILAATAMRETPVAVGGAVKVVPVLPLSLSFDHRAVNGSAATGFLESLADALTRPEELAAPQRRNPNA